MFRPLKTMFILPLKGWLQDSHLCKICLQPEASKSDLTQRLEYNSGNYSFSLSAGIPGLVLRCLLSPLSCPLSPQLVQVASWFWFLWRFLPVKREFLLSTVASCMLRMGDWIREKFQCNLLVPLARLLLNVWNGIIWNSINCTWLGYDCITMNWILIGLNWIVSLKCPEMTCVVMWHYWNKIEYNYSLCIR